MEHDLASLAFTQCVQPQQQIQRFAVHQYVVYAAGL